MRRGREKGRRGRREKREEGEEGKERRCNKGRERRGGAIRGGGQEQVSGEG